MSSLKGSFHTPRFNAGALICPQQQARSYLDALPDERTPGTVVRVGEAGMLYVSSDPHQRRIHKYVEIFPCEEPATSPRHYPLVWEVDAEDPLALFDLTGKEYGLITAEPGAYLIQSVVLDAVAVPGDPYYVGETWMLSITMLDPTSRAPVRRRWWDYPDP